MAFINSDDVLLLVDIGDYQLKAEFLLSNSLLDKKMLGEPSKLKKLKFVKKKQSILHSKQSFSFESMSKILFMAWAIQREVVN